MSLSENGNRTVKVMSQRDSNHFMVGQTVSVGDETGEIQLVIEHTIEDDGGDRHTHKRVVVDLGDREINVSSSDVEVLS